MKVTLADGRELVLPRLKFGVMGRPGSGKSQLIASMEKPLLGLCADPEEKLVPYLDRCGDVTRSVGQYGQTVLVGTSPTSGKPILQLECFYDLERENPQAFTALLARAEQIRGEVIAGMWASIGLDSWSQFETYALWRRKFGPFAIKDFDAFGRGNAAAADDLKMLVMARLMPLPCNLGISFHTTEKAKEEGGESVFGIKACTKALPTDLASLLPERYRSVSLPDGVTRQLYTKPDGRFDLCTLIDAPNPCPNDYKALFSNWIAKRAAMGAAPTASSTTAEPAPADPQKESQQ